MNTGLNNRRLELIRKGYVNKKELAEFLDVGKSRATTIFSEICEEIASEDKAVDILGLRTCRVMQYMGISEEDIRRYAADEKEGRDYVS